MIEELLPCPICQEPTKWCDFGGEKVSGDCCDNIECKTCGLLFQFDDRTEHGRDTLRELQADNAKAFNTRRLPPSVESVLEAARKVDTLIGPHTPAEELTELVQASQNHDKHRSKGYAEDIDNLKDAQAMRSLRACLRSDIEGFDDQGTDFNQYLMIFIGKLRNHEKEVK